MWLNENVYNSSRFRQSTANEVAFIWPFDIHANLLESIESCRCWKPRKTHPNKVRWNDVLQCQSERKIPNGCKSNSNWIVQKRHDRVIWKRRNAEIRWQHFWAVTNGNVCITRIDKNPLIEIATILLQSFRRRQQLTTPTYSAPSVCTVYTHSLAYKRACNNYGLCQANHEHESNKKIIELLPSTN